MDVGVHSALSGSLLNFKSSSLIMFNEVIPLALGVLVTITLVTWAINHFLRLAGLRRGLDNMGHSWEGYMSWAEQEDGEPDEDWQERNIRGWED